MPRFTPIHFILVLKRHIYVLKLLELHSLLILFQKVSTDSKKKMIEKLKRMLQKKGKWLNHQLKKWQI